VIDIPVDDAAPFEFPVGGGLDTETPVRQLKPGYVLGSDCYEPKVGGGYARLGGIERFDGRTSPSSMEVVPLRVEGLTGVIAVGDVLKGMPSTAQGTVVWSAAGYVALVNVAGNFATGDTLTVAGAYRGVAHTDPSIMAEQTNAMLAGAEDLQRQLIGQVPGLAGTPVRGAAVLYGTLYAWRDFDALTQKVYKATVAGWVEVPLLQRVAFTAGTGAEPAEGSVITKGGVTATVRRVVAQKGDWSPGTPAEGWLIISGASGAFTAGALTAGGTLTLSGPQSQIVLAAGGRWELKPYNFSGGLTMRLYGADGVNDLIEFDGEVLVPIPVPGMAKKPRFIELHKQHLWASFGVSVQRSGVQEPYQWTVLSGGAELAMGDDVTGLKSVSGSATEAALLVTSENKSAAIYGDPTGYRIDTLSTEVGAAPWTLQEIGKVIALDAAGMRDFTPTQAFGNFKSQTITDHIRSKAKGLTARASVLSKATGRYRLFLSDGRMLSGAPGKRWAWMFSTLPWTVNVACEGEIGGQTRVFIGCDDGYVREMDAGRSLDGQSMEFWKKYPFTVLGKPGWKKKGAHITAEVSGASFGTLKATVEVDYGDPDRLVSQVERADIPPPASAWDIGNWDTGVWDGQVGQRMKFRLRWSGENVSVTFFGESAQDLPHEVDSVCLWYRMLRRMK
jgi:hypothetical protein